MLPLGIYLFLRVEMKRSEYEKRRKIYVFLMVKRKVSRNEKRKKICVFALGIFFCCFCWKILKSYNRKSRENMRV